MDFLIIYLVVSAILTVIFAGIKIKDEYKKSSDIDTDDIIWCVFAGFLKGIFWLFTVPFALIAMLAMVAAGVMLKLEDKIK